MGLEGGDAICGGDLRSRVDDGAYRNPQASHMKEVGAVTGQRCWWWKMTRKGPKRSYTYSDSQIQWFTNSN
uniref:Uncharacterized protein n=1 Tax=Oryza meridionalis TaxID=40149 RepID=A0A0E0CIE3_9ORYZ